MRQANKNVIRLDNVLKATQLLLEMDVSAIQELYRQDMYAWSIALQQALNRYQAQQNHFISQPYSNKQIEGGLGLLFIDSEAQCLNSLLQAARAFLPLLTPEALIALQQQLSRDG